MIEHKFPQRSDKWKQVKLGKPSASQAHRIIKPGSWKPSDQARAYIYELIFESVFGDTKPIYVTKPMQYGIEHEDEAVEAFCRETGVVTRRCGFITDDDERYGASPDRLVTTGNKRIGVEVKCPEGWTHIGYMLDGPGDKYEPQVQMQMLVAELEVVHFWSWHASLPAKHVITHRNEKFIKVFQPMLIAFCDELDECRRRVQRMIKGMSNELVMERWAEVEEGA